MICVKCGCEIKYINYNYKPKTWCKKCFNEYHNEWQKKNKDKVNGYRKGKRWLNGCDNMDDLGEDITYNIVSRNGILRVKSR